MNAKKLAFILACTTLTSLNCFEAIASLKANEQSSHTNPNSANSRIYIRKNYNKPYIIDGYEVQVQWTDNLEIDCEILLEEDDWGESFREYSQSCKKRQLAHRHLVVPASIGDSPRDFYSQRTNYFILEYSPQDLVLISGFWHTNTSIEVVKIVRRDSILEIYIEKRGSYPEVAGAIVKVDLGFLEPNEYTVNINWKSEGDDGSTHFSNEMFDFRVCNNNLQDRNC